MRESEACGERGIERAVLGVFAVAVGVVGAAASVVLCLVVGWAYDLVCAMAGYCTFCPFSRWRAFCCTSLGFPLDTDTR